MTEPSDAAVFRLGYVPGVTPGKWARIWAERRPQVPLELVTATTDARSTAHAPRAVT